LVIFEINLFSHKLHAANGSFVYECNTDNFSILFMHLGVVKVGLLGLAKPEVSKRNKLDVR